MSKESSIHRCLKLFGMVEKSLAIISGGVVYCMAFLVFFDIITRFAHTGVPGIYVGVELGMAIPTFLALSWIQSEDRHIRFHGGPIVKKLGRFADVPRLLLTFMLFAMLFWRTSVNTLEAFRIGTHTMGLVAIPHWPFYAAATLGSFIISVRLIIQLGKALSNTGTRMEGDAA